MTGKDEGRTWPFGERKGPYNIFKKNPSVANDNGNLYEVDSDDFSDLRDINVAFSFFNITQVSYNYILFYFLFNIISFLVLFKVLLRCQSSGEVTKRCH